MAPLHNQIATPSQKGPKDSWYHEPCNLYGDYKIGENTTIGAFCDIGGIVGNNCKIQCHVSIPPLTVIEDNVFIGPGVKFCNDKHMDASLKGYVVHEGARIGAGAVICANVGKNSIIGAGSVVLKDVPGGATVVGNPAKEI